jgi:hypothetical protein
VLRALALALAALSLPLPARAHGVDQQTERRGAAYAARVRHRDGAPLAGAFYQVIRPGEPERIVREGRTGPDGWVEFLPDVPGRWRVRIVDATGHGAVVTVDVAAAPPASPPAPER